MRLNKFADWLMEEEFQSTHSIRSATKLFGEITTAVNISIHALHTECDDFTLTLEVVVIISIHALHTECDRIPRLPSQ